jgi:phosphoribosylglycinamide formyltransferase-1
MLNIVVLVSGGGSNLQALLDTEEAGKIRNGRIMHVISSSRQAYALERARLHGISTTVLERSEFNSSAEFDAELLKTLESCQADLIVLAGFLCILGEEIVHRYSNRIINVHPSLIPAFCGKGYYGLRVHQAVLSYGVKITGATVHFVNEIPDGGAIILQKAVPVKQGDTPEMLQLRVMRQAEWELLPRAVSLFCENKIRIEGNTTIIDE